MIVNNLAELQVVIFDIDAARWNWTENNSTKDNNI